jgi:hypothetical protein
MSSSGRQSYSYAPNNEEEVAVTSDVPLIKLYPGIISGSRLNCIVFVLGLCGWLFRPYTMQTQAEI